MVYMATIFAVSEGLRGGRRVWEAAMDGWPGGRAMGVMGVVAEELSAWSCKGD
jgi:hypothetical protein